MEAGATIGQYVLQRQLAVGGMAEIWLATTQGPAGFQKDVVIKRILPQFATDATFVEMFLDEARLAASLSHPHIVSIFNLGRDGDSYFIAMEFIDGYDLSRLLVRAKTRGLSIPAHIAVRIVADACAGLDYAHNFVDREGNRVGLVHRDISPHNLLISRNGVVKLVDFGVAKAASSVHKTQTGMVKGKLAYLSPEQIHAKVLDGRSDIFAMGIVLYELLTGERPFGGESELLAISAILNEPHQPMSNFRTDLPAGLDEIVATALAKKAQDRFQSAAEMERALEQWLKAQQQLVTQRDLADYLTALFSERQAAPTGGGPTLLGEVDAVSSTRLETATEGGWAGAVQASAPQQSYAKTAVALGAAPVLGLSSASALNSPDIQAASHAAHAVITPNEPARPLPGNGWLASPPAPQVDEPPVKAQSNLVWLAIAALLLAGIGAWWFTRSPEPEAVVEPADAAAPAPTAAPGAEPSPSPAAVAAPAVAPAVAAAGSAEASGSAEPAPAPTHVVAEAPAPTPAPAAKPKADKGPPPRVQLAEPRGTATIRIIYPGTSGTYKVSIDGKEVGQSPKATFPVSAGSRQVVVKFYGKKFEKTVRLAPGTSTSIRATF
jgi:serine/threonine-protein kinase